MSPADWVKYDARYNFFVNAIQYVNWERVEGDILEFGFAVGKSMALLGLLFQENLALWQYAEEACRNRRITGFDTCGGLPADDSFHPRWSEGSFATNYLHGHPSMAYKERITPDAIRRLFALCDLPEPELEIGFFEDTIPRVIPAKYSKAAIVHIDSDLYTSAKTVLAGVEPILQDGTLLLFDDWFMYKGDPNQGEQRAFREFLEANPNWRAIPYQTYSVFCNSFILHRR